MKKVLVCFFIALSALLVFSSHSIQALDIIDYPSGKSLLGQQNHSYSVVFRGNGEAIVSAKFILSNIADTPIKEVSLRVPKVEAQDVIAFQVIKEKLCARYEVSNSVSIESSYILPSRCLEYQQPDYYYDYSNNKYQKAKTEIQGDTIIVTLPTPIESNESGSFILYYSAFGYAKKNLFGAYDFAFETLKVDDRISNLTVGITTDSDLILKGAKANVNYRFTEDTVAQLKTVSEFGAPAANYAIDNFYQQIGQGSITKIASSLQPLDSYTVKGSYADSIFKLYAKGFLISAIVFLVIIFVVIKLAKKSSKLKLPGNSSLAFTIFGASFVSAFLTLIYTLAIIFISQLNLFDYYYGSLQTVFTIFILIISIVIYVLFVLVPAIFIGVKKGLWAGVTTLILTIIWLMLFLFVIFMIFFIANNSNNYPYPLKTEPLMINK